MAKCILIIDDEPMILESVSYNLKQESYEVITASNGETGLKLAKTEKIDLILLDLMLPGISGMGDLPGITSAFQCAYYHVNRQGR